MPRTRTIPFVDIDMPDPAFAGMDTALAQRIEAAEKFVGPFDFNGVRDAFDRDGALYFVYKKDSKEFGYENGKVHGPFFDIDRFEWFHGALLVYGSVDDDDEIDAVVYRGITYGRNSGAIIWFSVMADGRFVVVEERKDGQEGPVFLDGTEVARAANVKNVLDVGGELFFIGTMNGERIAYLGGAVEPCKAVLNDE